MEWNSQNQSSAYLTNYTAFIYFADATPFSCIYVNWLFDLYYYKYSLLCNETKFSKISE
jgi:hypothetical protein